MEVDADQTMKILVLNCGSSSIKSDLYDFSSVPENVVAPLWHAHLKWKNSFENPTLTIQTEKKSVEEKLSTKDVEEGLHQLLDTLYKGPSAVINSLKEIDVVGHRIVHGGKTFQESVQISSDVKKKIAQLDELAPLHNRAELTGIECIEKLLGNVRQIAVFDTAFHKTIPLPAKLYPGPYHWYEEGIQKFGFHGISYQYCSKRASQLLNKKNLKTVICHLGSGASLCAIQNGQSVDTTMGFTPLDGLMMDTRSGSVDPGILLYLLEKKKKSPSEISDTLYHKSGLLGISELSSDMQEIIEQSEKDHKKAQLALDLYLHRLKNLIGSMTASLNGIDLLVFTAGIGENSPLIRERTCKELSFLGLQLDYEKNNQSSKEDRLLSTPTSKAQVLLIHTQEAFEIACECFKLANH